MSHVSGSLLALGGSRIRHEKLAGDQQRQMNELMSHTQKAITQRQDANSDMEQQRVVNSQFVGMRKWREDVEREILKDRGSQQVFSDKVATSHIESPTHLNQVERSRSM